LKPAPFTAVNGKWRPGMAAAAPQSVNLFQFGTFLGGKVQRVCNT